MNKFYVHHYYCNKDLNDDAKEDEKVLSLNWIRTLSNEIVQDFEEKKYCLSLNEEDEYNKKPRS